jgi:hypothetical protein
LASAPATMMIPTIGAMGKAFLGLPDASCIT